MTPEQIDAITGDPKWRIPIRDACALNDIDSDLRVAFFLANCQHETGGFKHLREDLHYSAGALCRVFSKYFTPAESIEFAYDAERIGNRVYANRMGNGDEASGDGARFMGGGLLQITGRAMYRAAGAAMGINLEAEPERITDPLVAALTAAWFWRKSGCNEIADSGDFVRAVRVVNGGTNGLAERQLALTKITEAMA